MDEYIICYPPDDSGLPYAHDFSAAPQAIVTRRNSKIDVIGTDENTIAFFKEYLMSSVFKDAYRDEELPLYRFVKNSLSLSTSCDYGELDSEGEKVLTELKDRWNL